MQKEKFITVMAVLDNDTQDRLEQLGKLLELHYGQDVRTKGIPFHISLGSYGVEATEEIAERIIDVAGKNCRFDVNLTDLKHFGNVVRYIQPEVSEELLALHNHFDSDYANGYEGWRPHITVYRHSEPTKLELTQDILEALKQLSKATVVGIELGEFFPPKKIVSVLFEENY